MRDGELDRTIHLRPSYGSGPGGSGDLIPRGTTSAVQQLYV
jgi:hypothetical protein